MFKENQYVMHYLNGLSRIDKLEYKENLGGEYFKVVSVYSQKVDYIEKKNKERKMRSIISLDDLKSIIQKMNLLCDQMIKNRKEREDHYYYLALYGSTEDLIITIKRLYFIQQLYAKAKLSLKEVETFNLARQKLYEEVGFVLSIPRDEVENFLFKNKH